MDQAPEEMTIDDQGQRMANAITVAKGTKGLAELKRMVTTLGPMKRISTSFRFETGSTGLDAQSLSNVRQLARALARKQYSGRQILFAGFSDSEGAPDANARIAQRRADAAQKAVLNALAPKDRAGITIDTVSFGAAMPMACDDTVWGRQVNRRVEVWVQ
jgi:phosphate transport system substrate-binding protein